MKSLVYCTHFLTWHHIAHTTNFIQLVDLIIPCGARKLQMFVESPSRNAVYTSRSAVVDFIEALGTWVEESILKRLQKKSVFSVMVDDCTDITVVEELSVSVLFGGRWHSCRMLFGYCALKKQLLRAHI